MTTAFQDELLEIQSQISELEGSVEDQTKATAIEPLLNFFGWKTSRATEVKREEHLPQVGAVDYALKIYGESRVFIEAKKWSLDLSHEHEDQLLKYCNASLEATDGKEPLLAVLTNGRQWQLYLNPTKEHPGLRLFLPLDIVHDESGNVEKYFRQFLARNRVERMKRAPTAAQNLWNDRVKDETVMKALTDAWNKLTRNRREQVALLKRFVSSRDKIQAEEEHIRRFLAHSNSLFNQASGPQGNAVTVLPKPRGFTFRTKGEEPRETITFKTKSWNRYAHGLAELMCRRHGDIFSDSILAMPKARFLESQDDLEEQGFWRIENLNIYYKQFGQAKDLKSLGIDILKIFGYSEDTLTIHYD